MIEILLLSGATVAAAFITFGGVIKKLMAAPMVADIASSSYFLTTYAATGTISGLTIGIMSVLAVSITIRVWRLAFGYERLIVNGDSKLSAITAHIITGSAHWLRQAAKSVATGKSALPPSNMIVEWHYVPGVAYKLLQRS